MECLQSTLIRHVSSLQGCRILAMLLCGLAQQMQHLLPHLLPPRPPRAGKTIRRVLYKKRKMPSTAVHGPKVVAGRRSPQIIPRSLTEGKIH